MAFKINWEQVLTKVLDNDVARVDRNQFLSATLKPFCTSDDLSKIAFVRPESFIEPQLLDHLSKEEVSKHLTRASLISGGAGLMGATTMWLSVPADTVQFVANLVIMSQKLAYLYGWDDFFFHNKPTEETYARLALILGYGAGVREVKDVLLGIARDSMPNLNETMTHEQFNRNHPLVRKAVSALTGQLTRTLVSGAAAKVIPLVGAATSGVWSYLSFRPMAERIRLLLSEVMYTRLGSELR